MRLCFSQARLSKFWQEYRIHSDALISACMSGYWRSAVETPRSTISAFGVDYSLVCNPVQVGGSRTLPGRAAVAEHDRNTGLGAPSFVRGVHRWFPVVVPRSPISVFKKAI